MGNIEELAASLKELRDIQAINTVQAKYCHCVDGRRWKELAELFTEDAKCNYGFFGSYNGRDEIVNKFFNEIVSSAVTFMAHMVHNPVIEVRGDTATGSWYLTAQTTTQAHNRAVWIMGIYNNTFRRVGGAWKISKIDFEFWYYTPYEDGWAKTRMWNPA